MKSIIHLTRPSHWVKNLFVLMPLFFGHQLGNVSLLTSSIIAFFAFSFAASAIYCFNDIIDVEDDRRHATKCQRPIASGKVSVPMAYFIMAVMMMLSVGIAVVDNIALAMVIGVYLVMEFAYCTYLKRIAIIDVCILSLGFVLRIVAGGVATGIVVSHWLIMMTFLLTLFLGFAKRRDDVLKFQRTGIPPRHNTKRYNLVFVNETLTITGAVMLVCYIMYTVSPEVTSNFNNHYVYLTSIFVILGLLRYLQLALVDEKTGDPTKVLLRDPFTQIAVLAWIVSFLFIIYW